VSAGELPLLNAILNGSSALCLLAGYYCIRRKHVAAHRRCMIAAFTFSVLFLASYIVYHASVGSVHFAGEGGARVVYFTILTTHTILAAAVPFLAVITLARGLKRRFKSHRNIARWTLPVWLYVSVTGVLVYLMLYRLFPGA